MHLVKDGIIIVPIPVVCIDLVHEIIGIGAVVNSSPPQCFSPVQRIQDLLLPGSFRLRGDACIELDTHFVTRTSIFCGYDDDAVGSAGTINRGCRSVFQHLDRGDGAGAEIGKILIACGWDAIDDVQWVCISQGIDAADQDLRSDTIGASRRTVCLDIQTWYLSLQGQHGAGSRNVFYSSQIYY